AEARTFKDIDRAQHLRLPAKRRDPGRFWHVEAHQPQVRSKRIGATPFAPVGQMNFCAGCVQGGLNAYKSASLRLEKGAIVDATAQIIAGHTGVETLMGGDGRRLEPEAGGHRGGRSGEIGQDGFLCASAKAPLSGTTLA